MISLVFFVVATALAVVSLVALMAESRNPTGRGGTNSYVVPLVLSFAFLITGWVTWVA